MHRVLDKTREEWEKETNALKTEFFNMKPRENFWTSMGRTTILVALMLVVSWELRI